MNFKQEIDWGFVQVQKSGIQNPKMSIKEVYYSEGLGGGMWENTGALHGIFLS